MTLKFSHFLVLGTALILSCNSGAGVVYDESVNGDLGSAATATVINLSLGSNEIIGEVGDIIGGPSDFADAFSLGLSGLNLVAINVLGIEIDSGSTVRFSNCIVGNSPCNFSADENAGTSLTIGDLNGDLLAELLAVPPSLGFITDLFELTESEGPSRYRLDFVTEAAVPAPGSLLLLSLGFLAFRSARLRGVS